MRKDAQPVCLTIKETLILDEWVEMTWIGSVKKKYTDLGYVFTKLYDKFMCRVSDLPPRSNAMVNVKCPVCKQDRMVRYSSIFRVGHSICKKCVCIKDITGMKFGRYTVLSVDISSLGKNAVKWVCQCECGEVKSVNGNSLARGVVVSCGCYRQEIISGENNYAWNAKLTQEERSVGRSYPEYKEWERQVCERDGYQCQVCGDYGATAHHLYSYTAYPEHALDVDNGLTLCREHHKEFHMWMGGTRVTCTPDDLDRWINSK